MDGTRALAAVGLSATFFQDMFGLLTFDHTFAPVTAAPARIGRSHVLYCLDLYQRAVEQPEAAAATVSSPRGQGITAVIESQLRKTSLVPVISDFLFADAEAFIKELDPNHLVIDGRSLDGVPLSSLDDPNVDVITTHHYPFGEDRDFTKPIRAAHVQTKGKKPYFVGEFGFVKTSHIAAAIQTVIDEGISGSLLWWV